MLVNSKWDWFFFEIVHLVEMSKEGITNDEKISWAALHLVGVHSKLTSITLSLMKIQFWLHLEDLATDLEADWLQLFSNLITWCHDLTEVIVNNTVDSGDILLPLFNQFSETLVGDTDVWASGINDGWVLHLLTKLVKVITSIHEVLSLKGPLLLWWGPVWPVRQSLHHFKAGDTSNDLIGVHSTKLGIGLVIHVWSRNTETYNGSVNDSWILELPDIVKVLSLWLWVDSEAKDTISIVEADSLVKC